MFRRPANRPTANVTTKSEASPTCKSPNVLCMACRRQVNTLPPTQAAVDRHTVFHGDLDPCPPPARLRLKGGAPDSTAPTSRGPYPTLPQPMSSRSTACTTPSGNIRTACEAFVLSQLDQPGWGGVASSRRPRLAVSLLRYITPVIRAHALLGGPWRRAVLPFRASGMKSSVRRDFVRIPSRVAPWRKRGLLSWGGRWYIWLLVVQPSSVCSPPKVRGYHPRIFFSRRHLRLYFDILR